MKKLILYLSMIIILIGSLFVLTGCNMDIIDTNYTFDKCITYIGDERLEIEVKTWKDYEGEQIQIEAKDGTIYLVSMNNSMLIKE